jgi:hypothetical protein
MLQMLVTTAEECPVIGSHVWVQEANKQVWSKVFMLLRDATLYVSHKVCMLKNVQCHKELCCVQISVSVAAHKNKFQYLTAYRIMYNFKILLVCPDINKYEN